MIILLWIVAKRPPAKTNRVFRVLQIFSPAHWRFSHGSNDAQRTMGNHRAGPVPTGPISSFYIPVWVGDRGSDGHGPGTLTSADHPHPGQPSDQARPHPRLRRGDSAASVIQATADWLPTHSRRSPRRSWAPAPPTVLSAVRWGGPRLATRGCSPSGLGAHLRRGLFPLLVVFSDLCALRYRPSLSRGAVSVGGRASARMAG